MSDIVRIGVIGLGNIGQQHIDQIVNGRAGACVVSAVCSRQASLLADEIDAEHFCDYRSLIDSGLCDAVLVATPTMSHKDIGLYALEKGLHVLMEKPLGISVAQAEELLAATRPDQIFALMLNQRVAPVFAKAKQVLAAGTLGVIQRSQWIMTNWFRPEIYFQSSDWRATWRGEGGGLLLNQCIHNIDIYQWLCGVPTSVHGFCSFGKYHKIEVEDEVTAYFTYDNGASGVFVASTGESPGVNQLDIVGDKAMLSFDGQRLVLRENTPGTAQYSRETRDMFGQPDTSEVDITPRENVDQHALLIANFVGAISQGSALIAPASEGIHSLSMANAILLSEWSGSTVLLPLNSAVYQTALDKKLLTSNLREKSELKPSIDMDASYR